MCAAGYLAARRIRTCRETNVVNVWSLRAEHLPSRPIVLFSTRTARMPQA